MHALDIASLWNKTAAADERVERAGAKCVFVFHATLVILSLAWVSLVKQRSPQAISSLSIIQLLPATTKMTNREFFL
jgi:hypothetical protein